MANDTKKHTLTKNAISRRGFIGGLAAGAGVLAAPAFLRSARAERDDSELFSLGVWSGDPGPFSVVIGTRLAPEPLTGGGLQRPVLVKWEVATDPGMVRVVRRGVALAIPYHGHSVSLFVVGLRPDNWYYYRFSAMGEQSRIGRTRTFPSRFGKGRGDMRFALASCQDYRAGQWAAYRDMAEQDLDFVVHTGDYLYENGSSPEDLRQHVPGSGPEGEILTVEDYRNRYSQYRLDENLKAAHAAFPFIVTWDDHEVDNNYANTIAEDGAPAVGEDFLARRNAAYRVYSELMPLRPFNRYVPTADGGRFSLARRLRFGRLADIHVLDTRQFRTDQPCGDGFGATCDEVDDPEATMLGSKQQRQLFRNLSRSRATWNVLAQQTMLTRWDLRLLVESPVDFINLDAWDGYRANRQAITDFLAHERPNNPVVLTGDIHSSFAADVLQDFSDPSTVVAAEIIGTSISSSFIDDPATRIGIKQATLAGNPHIKFHEGAVRGYVLCDADDAGMQATFKGVLDVTDADSAVIDVARSRIEAGTPGISGTDVFADPDQGVFP